MVQESYREQTGPRETWADRPDIDVSACETSAKAMSQILAFCGENKAEGTFRLVRVIAASKVSRVETVMATPA